MAFEIEEWEIEKYDPTWELAGVLASQRAKESRTAVTQGSVYSELKAEESERKRKEEFWSDPCWSE